jgi:hypothetical protein
MFFLLDDVSNHSSHIHIGGSKTASPALGGFCALTDVAGS